MSYVIEMLNITKEFPGIKANDNVTLQLKQGEVHALLGENGAGKSTLMSILFGLYQPTEGKIMVRGQETMIDSPIVANELGIGMVHQHFKLVPNFTVTENIVLGVETTTKGILRMDEAEKKIQELSEKYKLSVDPKALISDITVGMQQRVEILKMLYKDNEVLIFDEPTAVLTPQEIEELMGIIKNLITEGKSVIIITHKLDEIKEIADRCTVLRKGQFVDCVDVKTTSVEKMAELMVGRAVEFKINKPVAKPGEVVLQLSNVSLDSKTDKKTLNNINFDVKAGEILTIAGIEGNGQTALVEVISGLRHLTDGQVVLLGEEITKKSIRKRNNLGLGHIPEDRHKHGLVLDNSLAENMVLQQYFDKKYQNLGFIKFGAIKKYTEEMIERFDIRTSQGAATITRGMSGGNQQKAIIAREISREPKLLIAVQPTRGLDVGAIEYIHSELIKYRDAGHAVLLVSLEMSEVMNLSDRILVMFEGELVGHLDPKNLTENELGLYMSGAKRGEI